MVATRLSEITTKGLEWYNSDNSKSPPARPPIPNKPTDTKDNSSSYSSSVSKYTTNTWDYASNSLSYVAEQTYSSLAGLLSSIYTESAPPTSLPRQLETIPEDRPSKKAPIAIRKYPELMSWMLTNPYTSVRGRHHHPSSLSAVRSLLTLVPFDKNQAIYNYQRLDPEECVFSNPISPHQGRIGKGVLDRCSEDQQLKLEIEANSSWIEEALTVQQSNKSVSNAETASQLAEGTVRALRDIALEEAMELHGALRFWTERWENPLLSWLEAGPWVWFSKEGYNHQEVGRKVSRIQAVLARRCSSIGELQQHLLRAGWQRGVAQWGVLGEGGEWAAVAGFDCTADQALTQQIQDASTSAAESNRHRRLSSDFDLSARNLSETPTNDGKRNLTMQTTISNLKEFPRGLEKTKEAYYGHGNVFVNNTSDGTVFTDDAALAEWSIDALILIRSQLYRAGNGEVVLPFTENWTDYGKSPTVDDEDLILSASKDDEQDRALPRWADRRPRPLEDGIDSETGAPRMKIVVSNLPLLAAEVSELLNSMEVIMELQRERRLYRLKTPRWARRNWYITSLAVPTVGYFFLKMFRDGYGRMVAKFFVEKVATFFKEHVSDPLASIYVELFKGRENISDREARMVAIFTLKKMIRSWLDETYPNMPEAERARRAEIMDISLLEETKEQNMKSLYEINSVIRMSFIEMQFIKKELLNALVAMDDMVQSNEINMNLAAVTPAVLLLYLAQRGVKFLLYALLKIGKSRAETYSSFRQIILDIERLLVMRDNPPSAPPPLSWGAKQDVLLDSMVSKKVGGDTLSADDTGMLMLHIHECRTILWQDRNRFSTATLRNVAEDLAELAGERGAVSVQQQILIVCRMGRTYPFLKVLSTGTPFQLSRVHSRVV